MARHHKRIDIQTTYLDANLTDFPLCVPVTSDTDIGAVCMSNGYDIRFYGPDGVSSLQNERESGFSVSGGRATGNFWAKSYLPTTLPFIFISYGEAGAADVSAATGPAWATGGGGVFVITGKNQIAKTSPDNWEGGGYITSGNANNMAMSFQVGQTNGYVMGGLNSDPTSFSNTFDYIWYCQADGHAYIYEGASNKGDQGAYTTSTLLSITYDGTNIRYYMDGTLKKTTARVVGAALYASFAIYSSGSLAKNVCSGTTADWIKFQYHNRLETDNELTWGSEQSRELTSGASGLGLGMWLR